MASGGDFLSSTLKGGSDFVFDYTCTLCQKEDKIREAVGWCKDCEDYLCQECYRNHLKPRPISDHKLLDKKHMPKLPSCDACQLDGKDKDAAGYCKTCDNFLCAECFKIHTKPIPMRNHDLLNRTQMPSKKQVRDDNQAGSHIPAVSASLSKKPATKQRAAAARWPRWPPASDSRASRIGSQQQQQQQQKQQQGDVRRSRVVHSDDITIDGQHGKSPLITGGVAMPANRLVIADCDNCRIILLALAGNTAQTQLVLNSKPLDITMVNSTQLAVTCPDNNKLIIVKVGDGLQLDREVKVNGRCNGIACMNDRLVVSYSDPAKVELLGMSGKVLQTIITEDQGKDLFSRPWYVEVSRDHASIYISDWDRDTVTRLSLAGQVLATYQDINLVHYPYALAVDKAGNVYVCSSATDNLVQLTADLTQPRRLLQRSDGVKRTQSVCYCQATEKLVIGMCFSDVIKVFQLR